MPPLKGHPLKPPLKGGRFKGNFLKGGLQGLPFKGDPSKALKGTP